MIKVSVLITVYNEEKYLRECLISLCNQTMREFEAICVDDASTDNSAGILEEFAKQDTRIKVWHNATNIGLTKSRSTALAHACGEYIALLDGDDFLSNDALMKAVTTCEHYGVNLALLDLKMYYAHNDIRSYVQKDFPSVISGTYAFNECLNGRLHSVYVAKRNLYESFPFDDSCRLYSDDNTARMHVLLSKTICLCDGTYFYRRHDNSETHKINVHRFDYLIANMRLAHELKKQNIGVEERRSLEVHRWKNIIAHYKLFADNKNVFPPDECIAIRRIFTEVLTTIDFALLPARMKFRPPYWSTRSMTRFEFYQRLYWLLRSIKRLFFYHFKHLRS